MTRPPRHARAFTFLELMFVVVILGILLAVGLPRFSGTSRRAALQTTARDMARMAAYARQAAISAQAETHLVLDQENRRWFYQGPASEEELERELRVDEDEPFERTEEELARSLHRRVSFAEIAPPNGRAYGPTEIARVTFFPSGSCTGVTIVLKNDVDRAMTVEIEAATGRSIAYLGGPKTFAERLEELGVDPATFGIERAEDTEIARVPGEGFTRVGGADERASAYADAAARILGRVNRDALRAEVLSDRMEDRIRDMEIERGLPPGGN